jgi:hypothetical protein
MIIAGMVISIVDAAQQTGPALDSLRITHQVDGWHEGKNGYVPFGHEKLFELINGGAPEYIDQGLVSGFFQRLTGKHQYAVEVFVEDFGTPHNASEMLVVKKKSVDSIQSLPDFDTGSIIVFPAIGAQVAFGAIGRFYFEATITGFTDNNEAKKELRRFFLFYREKAGACRGKVK